MTIAVDWDVKNQTKPNKQTCIKDLEDILFLVYLYVWGGGGERVHIKTLILAITFVVRPDLDPSCLTL